MKENLILVHSFPTNSVILSGLIGFLDDYFNVYFIDLPGFSKISPAETKVSLTNYADFVSNKIRSYNLESYIIGGISFGFLVVNLCNLDPKHCKAILAIEPYLNHYYLNIKEPTRLLYLGLINFLQLTELFRILWGNKIGENFLAKKVSVSSDKIRIMFKEMSPSVFYETAKIIFSYSKEPELQSIPYVLWINPTDETIKAEKVIEIFNKNCNKLLVQTNNIEHYPQDVSKEYFQDNLSPQLINEAVTWINKNYRAGDIY